MIDEKKLIEELRKHLLEYKKDDVAIGINVVKEIIRNQPKIGEWIPCSERLPEMCKPVLISYHRECDNFDKVATAYLEQDGDWRIEFGGSCGFESVIAWQPLPEAYHE